RRVRDGQRGNGIPHTLGIGDLPLTRPNSERKRSRSSSSIESSTATNAEQDPADLTTSGADHDGEPTASTPRKNRRAAAIRRHENAPSDVVSDAASEERQGDADRGSTRSQQQRPSYKDAVAEQHEQRQQHRHGLLQTVGQMLMRLSLPVLVLVGLFLTTRSMWVESFGDNVNRSGKIVALRGKRLGEMHRSTDRLLAFAPRRPDSLLLASRIAEQQARECFVTESQGTVDWGNTRLTQIRAAYFAKIAEGEDPDAALRMVVPDADTRSMLRRSRDQAASVLLRRPIDPTARMRLLTLDFLDASSNAKERSGTLVQEITRLRPKADDTLLATSILAMVHPGERSAIVPWQLLLRQSPDTVRVYWNTLRLFDEDVLLDDVLNNELAFLDTAVRIESPDTELFDKIVHRIETHLGGLADDSHRAYYNAGISQRRGDAAAAGQLMIRSVQGSDVLNAARLQYADWLIRSGDTAQAAEQLKMTGGELTSYQQQVRLRLLKKLSAEDS
ncbi:MAG: hypothetical protein AAFN70_08280, partial [Planctomycetota bacterium]